MPAKVTSMGIEWRDIQSDPLDFVLTVSIEVTGIKGVEEIEVSGAINGLRIDVGALLSGGFPILDIGSVGVSIKADMFGGKVGAGLIAGMLKIGEDGQVVPDDAPLDTVVTERILFFGLQGELVIPDVGGFGIRMALSQLGPLGVQVTADVPIIIDPVYTGITLAGFRGGVEFYSSLPSLTAAEQLRDPSLSVSAQPSSADWLEAVKAQVVAQHLATKDNPILGALFGAFTNPMIISGGGKIYSSSSISLAEILGSRSACTGTFPRSSKARPG